VLLLPGVDDGVITVVKLDDDASPLAGAHETVCDTAVVGVIKFTPALNELPAHTEYTGAGKTLKL
jgi:hypothetical protein